jgi:hypothetical protein
MNIIYMSKGGHHELEDDATPFFHHPRTSIFDEEENDVAFKFFNQDQEAKRKKNTSILSQL